MQGLIWSRRKFLFGARGPEGAGGPGPPYRHLVSPRTVAKWSRYLSHGAAVSPPRDWAGGVGIAQLWDQGMSCWIMKEARGHCWESYGCPSSNRNSSQVQPSRSLLQAGNQGREEKWAPFTRKNSFRDGDKPVIHMFEQSCHRGCQLHLAPWPSLSELRRGRSLPSTPQRCHLPRP